MIWFDVHHDKDGEISLTANSKVNKGQNMNNCTKAYRI